ncbi:type IV pilus assembly protein PilA [Paenibacillus endophyticus]|uniref:Type IV pilus assembly protein PilA n=1 Tax=Paenibacillus endophyticus TaxID=1294268 RepID=A0A7W5C4U9_9BACL|nr:prepilin-type N-terminal cleavage/methylation domain-containing protein [Paenibacillus endophyticus]MBB3151231.1 type IV pilus assembly protein PilA [Paenibacillus endophyticus]
MLMALKRNQKGLTLIELLAVLVIVGIIAAIAIPAISGTIEKSKTKADTASEQMIEEAALRYFLEEDPTPTTGNTATVAQSDLVTKGYLNKAVVFNDKADRTITGTKGTGGWTVKVAKVPAT